MRLRIGIVLLVMVKLFLPSLSNSQPWLIDSGESCDVIVERVRLKATEAASVYLSNYLQEVEANVKQSEFHKSAILQYFTALEQYNLLPEAYKPKADFLFDEMLHLTVREGGRTFSQLYVAEALLTRYNGLDFNQIAIQQKYTPEFYDSLVQFLNVRRFYSFEELKQIHLPNNYAGVAAKLAGYNVKLGIESPDSAAIIITSCIDWLEKNNGWLEDNVKLGGFYDRYHFEYIRFITEAIWAIQSESLFNRLKPYIINSLDVWYNLHHPFYGHSAHYGRSRQNAWDDVFETALFVKQLSAKIKGDSVIGLVDNDALRLWANAWNNYNKYHYDTLTHLNRMLSDGKQTWSYAGPNRIESYSFGTWYKVISSIFELKKFNPLPLEIIEKQFKSSTNFVELGSSAEMKNYLFYAKSANNMVCVPVLKNGLNNSDYTVAPYGYTPFEVPVLNKESGFRPRLIYADTSFVPMANEPIEVEATNSELEINYKTVLGNRKVELEYDLEYDTASGTLKLEYEFSFSKGTPDTIFLALFLKEPYDHKNNCLVDNLGRKFDVRYSTEGVGVFNIERLTLNPTAAQSPKGAHFPIKGAMYFRLSKLKKKAEFELKFEPRPN